MNKFIVLPNEGVQNFPHHHIGLFLSSHLPYGVLAQNVLLVYATAPRRGHSNALLTLTYTKESCMSLHLLSEMFCAIQWDQIPIVTVPFKPLWNQDGSRNV
jgi:hypothetical protein